MRIHKFEFCIKIFDRASFRVLPVMDMTENIFPCEQTIHSYIFISIQWNLDLSIHVLQLNSSKFNTPCQTFQNNFELLFDFYWFDISIICQSQERLPLKLFYWHLISLNHYTIFKFKLISPKFDRIFEQIRDKHIC